MVRNWLLIGCALALFMETTCFAGVERLTLVVGDIYDLPDLTQGRLKISRRGIIEAVRNPPQGWQLVALRRGQVTLTVEALQGQRAAKTFLVEVLAKTSRPIVDQVHASQLTHKTDQPVLAKDVSQTALCKREPHARCGANHVSWSGEVLDEKTWHRLVSVCSPSSDCLLTAEWSQEFWVRTANAIKAANQSATLQRPIRKGGSPYIEATCASLSRMEFYQRLNHLTSNLIAHLKLPLVCQASSPADKQQILVQVRAFDQHQLSRWQAPNQAASSAIPSSRLVEDLAAGHRGRSGYGQQLAQIELAVTPHTEHQFQVDQRSSDPAAKQPQRDGALDWGLNGVIRLETVSKHSAIFHYHLALTNPSSNHQEGGQQLVSGQQSIERDQPTDIMIASLLQQLDDVRKNSLLAEIPIIGPMYRGFWDQTQQLSLAIRATWLAD